MIIEHYSMNNKIGPSSSIGRIKPFKISVWEIKHTSGGVIGRIKPLKLENEKLNIFWRVFGWEFGN